MTDTPADDGNTLEEVPEAGEADPAEHRREEELNGLRIRQYTALRRGAFRARSYALIGAVACGFAGVLLLLIAVAHTAVRRGVGMVPLGCALGAAATLALALHFGRRVRDLNREIAAPAPLPPPPPGGPDFSTLSDGSQRWKNLEDIR